MAGLRVEAVETILIDLPTIRPHVLAMTTMQRQSIVLVRVRCSDGVTGIGEGTTIGGLSYGEESPEGIKLAIDTYMAPILLACDPARPSVAMDRIARSVVGNHFARCAVETALLPIWFLRLRRELARTTGPRQEAQQNRERAVMVTATGGK